MTTFDSPDAPPLSDEHAPLPGVPSPDATAIAIALNRVAAAIDKLASSPPGVASSAPVPSHVGSPMAPSAPPGGPSADETQVKMSKKVFAICKQQNWDIADVGTRALGRPMVADSRTWSKADLAAVLDVMKSQWGVG